MKLATVTYAKNEADIIESFVRHHLRFVDYVVVVDHDSSDDTKSILNSLKTEGLALFVLDDQSVSYQQGLRTTQAVRHAFAKLPIDAVIVLDADEFLKCESRSVLEDELIRVPRGRVAQLAWQNYIASAHDDCDEIDPIRRIEHRAKREPIPEQKVVVTRELAALNFLELSPGNHMLLDTRREAACVEGHILQSAAIAHFPLRSTDQAISKIVLGWLAMRSQNPEQLVSHQDASSTKESLYWHSRAMFARWAQSPRLSSNDLTENAWRYYVMKTRDENVALTPVDLVRDPLTVHYRLQYTRRDSIDPLRTLALWTDRLLDTK
jgi:hypothetical protein